jgi:hypothetical protein
LGAATASGFNRTGCFDCLHNDLVWSGGAHSISQTLTKTLAFHSSRFSLRLTPVRILSGRAKRPFDVPVSAFMMPMRANIVCHSAASCSAKLGYVGAGILKGDKLAAARQRYRLVKSGGTMTSV